MEAVNGVKPLVTKARPRPNGCRHWKRNLLVKILKKQPGLHDQAREVFQESKKLSSSSIPKDSGFFSHSSS